MEYYNLMMLIGCCILYIALNIYPIVTYGIYIIKNFSFDKIIDVPLIICVLLIPIIGSLFSLIIIDETNKYWQIAFYIGSYLIIIGFVINLFMIF